MDELSAEPAKPWIKPAIVLLSIGLWLLFRHMAPVPDVAWLMEGARRWVQGSTLYVDVREINPPLIFYEMVGLSGGAMTNSALVGGIVIATAISSLWIARHHGDVLGLGAFVSIAFAGMTEFGQREHLLLIFVVPYLLARGPAWERVLMGLWAFLGVGLKPHFLLIVILPALIEAWRDRSSLFAAQKLALAGACVAYVVTAYFLHPAYFRELVPLAQAVYNYSMRLPPLMLFQTIVIACAILLADEERRPLAAAVAGALGCYYLQARYWPYQFIAAAGLGMLLCFWQRRLALWTLILFIQVFRGPYSRQPQTPIPEGIERVAVLSVHPSAAYPTVTGCGVTNIIDYGSLGWMPGPWNVVTDSRRSAEERQRAWALLMNERDRLRRDILASDTELIISDARRRKPYFQRPVDYMRFLGPLPGFKLVRRVGWFELWAKAPLSSRLCKERF